ncbi:MAG: hypothetical protein HY460_02630, partial [Parcubacteria group bacterium]|nr:hypothetical protein [Parcubacteria group bacterium]
MREDGPENYQYITLAEAARKCSYTQEYLSLRARQGKLRAQKVGRNWVTTEEWLQEYLAGIAMEPSSVQMPSRTLWRAIALIVLGAFFFSLIVAAVPGGRRFTRDFVRERFAAGILDAIRSTTESGVQKLADLYRRATGSYPEESAPAPGPVAVSWKEIITSPSPKALVSPIPPRSVVRKETVYRDTREIIRERIREIPTYSPLTELEKKLAEIDLRLVSASGEIKGLSGSVTNMTSDIANLRGVQYTPGGIFVGGGPSFADIQNAMQNGTISPTTFRVGNLTITGTCTGCGGGGGSLFTDAGSFAYLTATGDDLIIGSSTVDLARLGVIGDSDEIQLGVRAHSTQNANTLEIQNSAGTFLSGFTGSGGLLMNIASDTAVAIQQSGNTVFTIDTNLAASDAVATTTNSGSLIIDSTTLSVNANENRVGIGTASPTSTLSILGSLNLIGAATSTEYLVFNGTPAAAADRARLLFDWDTTSNLTGSSNGTVVGIDAASSFAGNYLDIQTGGFSLFSINATSTTAQVATTTAATSFVFDTNTFVVNANENEVGIGTANASSTFGVLGTSRLNGNVTITGGTLTLDNVTGSTQCLQSDSNGVVSGVGSACTVGASGAWESIFAGTALTPTSTSAGIFVRASSTVDSTLRVTGAFSAASPSATSTFAWSGVFDTATFVVNANENRVGVGTASPTSTFNVVGDSRIVGSETITGNLTV